MPDLTFLVEKADVEPFAVAPLLIFKLRISQTADAPVPIHAIALRCQIRIEPTKRRYEAQEKADLLDLFDRPERWGQTLRAMLWTHSNVMVPAFETSIVADLPIPCSFDFNVAATKYFHALQDGEIPLTLLFSGTVFHEMQDYGLQVAQLPWDKEASYRLPVSVWKEMMQRYYPNTAWLNLRQDVFDRLSRYKSRHGLPTWEAALENLLQTEAKEVAS